ncbi:hypothetical protein, partial [Klebsiella aerogenes]|uniref:hypothetical protein n=1 Tax=Klebsiella aerogenes TaxID=548 RepID=UPI001CC50C1E
AGGSAPRRIRPKFLRAENRFYQPLLKSLIQDGFFCNGFFDLESKLAAGGSDIMTLFTAECAFRSSLSKNGEEGVLAIFFRSDPRQAIDD